MRKQKNRFLKTTVELLLAFGVMFSWLQIFWPPISMYRKMHNIGFRKLFTELLKVDNSIYGFPASGYVFLLLTLILLLIAISLMRGIGNYLEYSRVGISLLETEMELVMEDAARRRATLCRKQTFHANRSGVTAYHLIHRADAPGGSIDPGSIELESFVAGKAITKELLMRGNGASRDVIEIYKKPLPTSLLATYLPNWLVALLQNTPLFDSSLVRREGRVTYIDEYSGSECVLSITSLRYPVINTKIKINFISGTEPEKDSVRAFLIQENAVEEIDVRRSQDNGRTIFEIVARSLYRETLRIQWINRSLIPVLSDSTLGSMIFHPPRQF